MVQLSKDDLWLSPDISKIIKQWNKHEPVVTKREVNEDVHVHPTKRQIKTSNKIQDHDICTRFPFQARPYLR